MKKVKKLWEVQALPVQVSLPKGVRFYKFQTPIVDLRKIVLSHPPWSDAEGKEDITEEIKSLIRENRGTQKLRDSTR